MGGCATKPKVLKADDAKAPEPLPDDKKPLAEPHKLQLPLIVDDDSSNKRHSLSSLFTQNEDGKVIPENEKVAVSAEETVTQEKPEAEKPSEDGKCHGTVTQELAEKPSWETESNEAIKGDSRKSETERENVFKGESADVAVEKISGENETESNEVIKRESEEVMIEKISRETETEISEITKGKSEEVKVENISREIETEAESNEVTKGESSEVSEVKTLGGTESNEVMKGESTELVVEKISGEAESIEVTKGEFSEGSENKEAAEERKQEILEAEKPREVEGGKEMCSGEGETESNERVKQESGGDGGEEMAEKVIQVVEETTTGKVEEKSQSAGEEAKSGP